MTQSEFKKRWKAAGYDESDLYDLGARIIATAAEDQIANGELDPSGKGAAQIGIEAAKKFLRKLTPGRDLAISVIHQDELLAQGRRNRRKGGFEIACLFYATWLEHWVNLLLYRSRCGLNDGERVLMLRELPLKAKFSWMLVALGYPRIPAAHLECVARIAEARNAFVHYKWQAKLRKHADEEEQRIRKTLQAIEKTIRYLMRFEDRHLLKGTRRILAQIAPKEKKKK